MSTIERSFLASLLTVAGAATGQTIALDDAALAARFDVNGVRISASSRIAIVNDRLRGVGEKIDGAQILAIEGDVVHLRVVDRVFAMRVGSSSVRESRFARAPAEPRAVADASLQPIATDRRPRALVPTWPASAAAATPAHGVVYGPVRRGETLSQIAAQLATLPGERNALMATLFEANPQAFGDTMDLLYAGASLSLPSPATGNGRGTHAVAVRPGDTLSQIAVDLVSEDVSVNELMRAIYAHNPGSFGDSPDLLYAGTVLQIPATTAIREYARQATLDELPRRTAWWRPGARVTFGPGSDSGRRWSLSHNGRTGSAPAATDTP